MLAGLASCSSPPVQTAADRQNAPFATTLSGQVVVQGPARGDAVALLYRADQPPPPTGAGHPVSFVSIPARSLFGAALHDGSASGPFAADYTFSLVAPGRYLVAAFLDGDGCLTQPAADCRPADFNPFYAVTREPNGVDLVGGHVDVSGQLQTVEVPEPDGAGHLAPVGQVQVVIGQPVGDRPAFRIDAASAALSATEPTALRLQALSVHAPPVDEPAPAFLLRYVDDDRDGRPDLDAREMPMLWPKVFVRKVSDDGSGPAAQGGLVDDASSPVLLATALPQAVQLDALLADAQGEPDVSKVVPLSQLMVAILPAAVDARDPAHPVPLAQVPPGRYAVTVEQFTGQTWRVPNELAPEAAPSFGLSSEPSQGFLFIAGR